MYVNKSTMEEFDELANANLELQGRKGDINDLVSGYSSLDDDGLVSEFANQLEGFKSLRDNMDLTLVVDNIPAQIKATWLSLKVDLCKIISIHERILEEPELIFSKINPNGMSNEERDRRLEELLGMSGDEYFRMLNDTMKKLFIVTGYTKMLQEGGES